MSKIPYAAYAPSYTNDYGQRVFRFANEFGASVIPDPRCTGRYELAVLTFATGTDKWEVAYNTEITCDIVAHLTEGGVQELLAMIALLDMEGSIYRRAYLDEDELA